VSGKIDDSIRRNRKGARADCDMRAWHADEIDQQRHG
jgi:hypothetical protein